MTYAPRFAVGAEGPGFSTLLEGFAEAMASGAAARWPHMDAAERGAIEHLVREHADTARRLRVAVWADRIREGGR